MNKETKCAQDYCPAVVLNPAVDYLNGPLLGLYLIKKGSFLIVHDRGMTYCTNEFKISVLELKKKSTFVINFSKFLM